MNDNKIVWRYAGLATQFFAGSALTVFAGFKADEWIKFKIPLLVWLLPLLFILILIIRIIKDTNPKK